MFPCRTHIAIDEMVRRCHSCHDGMSRMLFLEPAKAVGRMSEWTIVFLKCALSRLRSSVTYRVHTLVVGVVLTHPASHSPLRQT